MLKIHWIEALPNYKLKVEFENGAKGECDVSGFLDKGDFSELRDQSLFRQVKNIGFSAEWPNELDLSSDTLFTLMKAA